MTTAEKIALSAVALAAIAIGAVAIWQSAFLLNAWPYGAGAVLFTRSVKP